MVNNVDMCVLWLFMGNPIRRVSIMGFVLHVLDQVTDHVCATTLVLYL